MSQNSNFSNTVRQRRSARNWSQQRLAELVQISRAEISAIEIGRIVPSTAVALALAEIFDCKVEDIFCLSRDKKFSGDEENFPVWAWEPRTSSTNVDTYSRLWRARVSGRVIIYPAEPTLAGILAHDGYMRDDEIRWAGDDKDNRGIDTSDLDRLLVIAGCDPAVGLLANECLSQYYHNKNSIRLLPITRSSRQALQMLAEGLVHMAGVHLADSIHKSDNQTVVRKILGAGYRLLRITKWEEGLALDPAQKCNSINAAINKIQLKKWIAREPGSGARKCMDQLFIDNSKLAISDIDDNLRESFKVAGDHYSVVEAIRRGWGQAGVCVKLPAVEAGLDFLTVQTENYDLCYHAGFENDPRFKHILNIIRSVGYRQKLGELPGYNTSETGLIIDVK